LLKLHQIYIRKFLLLFLALFFIVGAIVYYWLKEFYIEQTKISLLHNIELISHYVDEKHSLDKIANRVKKELDLRLTIVNEDGDVIAESHEDKSKMENHKYREEIMESKTDSYGSIVRYSDTLNTNLLYVAKKFIDHQNNIYFVRMARELKQITNDMVKLGLEVASILILFFAITLFVAYKISTNIQNETNKIMQFLYDLTKKKKNSYIKSDFSQEFYNITKHLTKVSKILTKQDKQKAKYTARLKTSNAQKDDIISAISHEFKNPIAVINGYSQTLLEDKNINIDIQQKFLSKINKNGNKLSELIDTLRLAIKLDEKKQPLRYTEVNLNETTKECADSLISNYKNRDIDIVSNDDVVVKADETLIGIAITNLIENALKYSEDKVTVTIDRSFIEISDHGIGINSDDIQKITDKFYRVSNNGWNNSLGLGLSIVSNIINIHNFKLDITSVENKGSSFKILF